MNRDKIIGLMTEAIRQTLLEDRDILEWGRSERAFNCLLAAKVRELLGDGVLRCDSNYLRHGTDRKELTNRITGERKRIEADLVIHQRGSDPLNILIMELETIQSATETPDDLWKVRDMTTQDGEYRYLHGLHMTFGIEAHAGEILSERWFDNGQEVDGFTPISNNLVEVGL